MTRHSPTSTLSSLTSTSGSSVGPRLPTRRGYWKAKSVAEAQRPSAKWASRLTDERSRVLGGWRAETLAQARRLIQEVDPDIMEECKWSKPSNPLGVPVWSHAGIVCTGEAYNQLV